MNYVYGTSFDLKKKSLTTLENDKISEFNKGNNHTLISVMYKLAYYITIKLFIDTNMHAMAPRQIPF